MKNSKLLLYLLPLAALLFWYLGKPPANQTGQHPANETLAPPAPTTTPPTTSAPAHPAAPAIPHTPAHESLSPVAASVSEQSPAPATNVEQPAPSAAIVPVTGNPDIAPDQKLEALRLTFHTYGQRFKGNPVGDNAEITAALAGKNPGTANFLADAPHGLNDKGELCDGYGTPYFFHQLSGTEMEIRSAGPDQKMFTPDDLVTK